MPEPVFIRAKRGLIAERAVVVGDPARVKQLSEQLDDPNLVNESRGFLTYTGKFEGVPVTVACHGVGGASSAGVVEELIMLGSKVIVRLGTTGAFLEGMRIGDVVVPTGAAYVGGPLLQYVPDARITPVPSFEVQRRVVDELTSSGIRPYIGPVFSSDAFYAEDPDFVKKWVSRGYISVEMECATIFGICMMRGVKSGAALLVSDNLVEHLPMHHAEHLREYVNKVGRAIFRAIISVDTSSEFHHKSAPNREEGRP
ncbi:MAG: purine-nucleoside phosphorylase [Thaumarchaeota archaeon]|nr:purine-nucleoside phosphorylase [Candidatus Calditenuaceae archaeon]MDW8187456.1 purine-nucleoside phosphorylase [Nitrososphaerota archaeon]